MRRVLLTLRLLLFLGFMSNGFELMRDWMKAVTASMPQRLSYRVALLALVAVVTSGAVAACSETTDPAQPAMTVETQEVSLAPTPAATPPTLPAPTRPASTATPGPRTEREVPSEWQVRTRSSPELAAQYPLADLYTDDEIAYFKEIAFGMGPSGFDLLVPAVAEPAAERRASFGEGIQKWGDGEVGYYVDAEATTGDLADVHSTIARLEALIPMLKFRPVKEQSEISLLIAFLKGIIYLTTHRLA